MVEEALLRTGLGGGRRGDALLVLSEIVTNAFVHTGTAVTVLVWSGPEGTRVEVEDGGTHLPVRRQYAETAGTGRGLRLVDELSDRWGSHRRGGGKVVWFEIGQVTGDFDDPAPTVLSATPGDDLCTVTLLQAPLLMLWAWQEHAAALLREYLLLNLDDDDTILGRHAQASEALRLLGDQLPLPHLPDRPEALMARAVEPGVTAVEVVLRIPQGSLDHFVTLDDLLAKATRAARAGRFLVSNTQPEIQEARAWLCAEVARQTSGEAPATPWTSGTDVDVRLADPALLRSTYAGLADDVEPLVATDESGVIVAASLPALQLLGYDRADDLVGRRVLGVIPARYHQAHIAGLTLNATNGRDNLLGVPLTVPMVRADGAEMSVRMEVCAERVGESHHVFVARFKPA